MSSYAGRRSRLARPLALHRLEDRTVPAAFNPSNIVAVRVGTGAALTANATATFLDEYTAVGTNQASPVQTVALPTTTGIVRTVTAAASSGTTATITTSAAHGFTVGQTVAVAGVTPAGYNGTYSVVATPTPTTFTVTTTGTNLGAGTAFGTATLLSGAFALVGNNNTEGQLVRAADGHSLSLAGYAQAPGSSTAGANREVAVVAPGGTVDASTQLPAADAGTVRGAVSAAGQAFWLATSGGTRYVTLGNSGAVNSVQVSNLVTSPSAVQISDNGQLAITASAGLQTNGFAAIDGPGEVGTGLPVSGGQPVSVLQGFPTPTDAGIPSAFPNPRQFAYVTTPAGSYIYVADARINGNGGLYKYSKSPFNNSYALDSSYLFPLGNDTAGNPVGNTGTGLNGLAVSLADPNNPVVFATTVESGTVTFNRILRFADTASFAVVATAAANTQFRGVALAPTNPGTGSSGVTLTTSSPTGTYGTGVTLTAAVTGTAPTGVVSFRAGGKEIGAAPVVNGTATLAATTNLPASASPYSVTAVYTGDAATAASTSGPQAVTISKATSGTAVVPTLNFIGTGLTDTLTATVTPEAGGVPTGKVTFFNGGVSIGTAQTLALVVNKVGGVATTQYQATLTTSFAAAGDQKITAVYTGDTNFTGSTSGESTVTVVAGTTTTVTSSQPAGPAVGTAVTFTAAVTTGAAVPGGTFQFFDNQLPLTAPLTLSPGGTASVTVNTALVPAANSLTPGAHSVIAVYVPDAASQNTYFYSTGVFTQRVQAQAFGPHSVLVERVGNGSTPINTVNGNSLTLDEYTPAGTLVQAVAFPIRDDGTTHALVAQAQQSATGAVNLSGDGRYVFLAGLDAPAPITVSNSYFSGFAGYDATAGTYAIGSTSDVRGATINRTIGRVRYDGTVETGVSLSDAGIGTGTVTANVNAVYSPDGSSFYVTGGGGGIRYVPAYTPIAAAQTSTQVSSSTLTFLDLQVAGGQLYASSSSGTSIKVGAVGTGTPTTTGAGVVNLPGIPLNVTGQATVTPKFPAGVYFTHLDGASAPAGINTLYIGDDGDNFSKGSVTKWSLVSGTWTKTGQIDADGTVVPTFYWLAGKTVAGTTTLYSTYGSGGSGNTGPGYLYQITDANGYNQGFSTATVTTLATLGATSSTTFRGQAFAPQNVTATLTASSGATAPAGQPVTLTATVAGGPATPTGAVYFYDGTTAIGSATLNASGVATLTTAALAAGAHAFSASAAGDAVHVPTTARTTVTAAAGDTTAPTASGTFGNVTTRKGATYTFSVTLSDNVAVLASSVQGSDFTVTGPNGYSQTATLVSLSPNSNGSPLVATLSVPAPGGSFDVSDNGTYTVSVTGSITDTATTPNAVATGSVGTFAVQAPVSVESVVTKLSDGTTTSLTTGGQRSLIPNLVVTFDGLATGANLAASYKLLNTSTNATVALTATTTTVGGKTVATITPVAPLANAFYTFTAFGTAITTANVAPAVVGLDGDNNGTAGGDYTLAFHLFAGDVTGDTAVDGDDLAQLAAAFNSVQGDTNYRAYLDLDGDGAVDGNDLAIFAQSFALGIL